MSREATADIHPQRHWFRFSRRTESAAYHRDGRQRPVRDAL